MISAIESANKLKEYEKRIEELCAKGGYWDRVKLLGATKTVEAERINEIRKLTGLSCIGENRVQELLEKYDALNKEGLELHFIGKLQSNKVKYIIDKVTMIESLDSLSLAKEIQRQAKKRGIVMDVLIEVNIGREKEKSGVLPEDIYAFIDSIKDLDAIRVKGIMTIAPRCDKKEERIKFFEETYKIFIDISSKMPHNISMSVLSMGMTESYEEAILSGANLVRIGSGIFGKRDTAAKSEENNNK